MRTRSICIHIFNFTKSKNRENKLKLFYRGIDRQINSLRKTR